MAARRSWSIDDLIRDRRSIDDFPPREEVGPLVDELFRHWFDLTTLPRPATVSAFLCSLYGFSHDASTFDWKEVQMKSFDEDWRLSRIMTICKHYRLFSEENGMEIWTKIQSIAKLRTICRTAMIQHSRLLVRLNTDLQNGTMNEMRQMMPDDLLAETNDENMVTRYNHDACKLNSFQTTVIRLLETLEAFDFRRADGKFYSRVETTSGLETQSFRAECTIEEFIDDHTNIDDNFMAWKELFDNTSVYAKAVDYFKSRPLSPAIDLDENYHLRTYEGDEYGRFAVMYDVRGDMAWPLGDRTTWPFLETTMNRLRASLFGDDVEKVAIPNSSDVCVKHIPVNFYHNHYANLYFAFVDGMGSRWRESFDFECVTNPRIDCLALGDLIASRIDAAPDWEPERWGNSWQCVARKTSSEAMNNLNALDCDDEFVARVSDPDGRLAISDEFLKEHVFETITSLSCVRGNDGKCYVPLVTPERRRRARVTDEELDELRVYRADMRHNTCVRSTDGRFFRVDTGTSWMDCRVAPIDSIFDCQHFTEHDKFMICALLGRTFFEVGELDQYEMTLFFEGVGGCGKSTCMKTMQEYWPNHLVGILSSNIEAKFGMSCVLKDGRARAIFCNEVSHDLNLVQEEWQTSTSGEWGSFAVKHRAPLECKCKAQQFWVGNGFPTHFKNEMGQVSRRLAGVLMAHPVTPRNGRIFEVIRSLLGTFNHGGVLAYRELLRQYGSTDPMSCQERMPPAFQAFYKRNRCRTDRVLGFIQDGSYVVIDPTAHIGIDTLRELWDQFLIREKVQKAIKFGPEVFRVAFGENGIRYEEHTRNVIGLRQVG